MFQSFEDVEDPARGVEHTRVLRAELRQRELNGFLVPRADEHQGEYVASYAERLAWLTGFSGSAGLAVVLEEKAALFVDGRYTLQVREQVDGSVFEFRHVTEEPPSKWLSANISRDDRIGFDPWLHTRDQVRTFEDACNRAGATLVPLPSNPIDTVWEDQPAAPAGRVFIHPLKYAGEAAAEKIGKVQSILKDNGNTAVVLTMPDSIAWLLNIRGDDLPHIPVALAFVVLPASGRPTLYIEAEKLDEPVVSTLQADIDLREPIDLEEDLKALAGEGNRVSVDPSTAAYQITRILEESGAKVVYAADPCALPKACKNAVEIEGARIAQQRDGVAMCRFLHWLDQEIPKGRLDEISVAKELELFRTETGKLRDVSFPSISAAGPHAAIPHYRVSYKSSRKLGAQGVYLIDSGGQYLDGTTDITRTIALGDPSDEIRDRYTRVLKGHIAIATARFPQGTTGTQIDMLARRALWEVGLDFDHGTGHGVGSYLSVHEGPQRISKAPSRIALEPGMIISNEPGFYKEGEFGIRIENLVLVREDEELSTKDSRMLCFETLTWAPIDQRLIKASLLTQDEAAWLNGYHAKVLENVGPRLKEPDREWLEKMTRPIKGKA